MKPLVDVEEVCRVKLLNRMHVPRCLSRAVRLFSIIHSGTSGERLMFAHLLISLSAEWLDACVRVYVLLKKSNATTTTRGTK